MFILKEPPVPDNAVHLLGTPAGTIYVYGQIRYTDVFRAKRVTNYRLMYGGAEGVRGGLLKYDVDGNNSD